MVEPATEAPGTRSADPDIMWRGHDTDKVEFHFIPFFRIYVEANQKFKSVHTPALRDARFSVQEIL